MKLTLPSGIEHIVDFDRVYETMNTLGLISHALQSPVDLSKMAQYLDRQLGLTSDLLLVDRSFVREAWMQYLAKREK